TCALPISPEPSSREEGSHGTPPRLPPARRPAKRGSFASAPTTGRRPPVPGSRSRRRRLQRHQREKPAEPALADPFDVEELVDASKTAAALPVLENAGGQGRADPGQGQKLVPRGRVEIDPVRKAGFIELSGFAGRLRRKRNRREKPADPALADPFAVEELVDASKTAAALPVLENAGGQGRADPGQGQKLVPRGRVEIDPVRKAGFIELSGFAGRLRRKRPRG